MPVTIGAPMIRPLSQAAQVFAPGVLPYRLGYYDPGYAPQSSDLLCTFRIIPRRGVDLIEAAAVVAAESSTGTWAEVR
ncbi:MAG: hypothetical protein ACREMA_20825, partial [Longimicrobiales bacterium]